MVQQFQPFYIEHIPLQTWRRGKKIKQFALAPSRLSNVEIKQLENGQ